MVTSVKKRDGRIVLYDVSKIANAILKAMQASGEGNAADAAKVANVTQEQLERLCSLEPPSIEQIQDQVEKSLMSMGFSETAKKYILYRSSRTKVREMSTHLMKVFDELTNAKSIKSNLKRDNANINGDTPMGTMLQYGSEAAKDYYEKYLLTPEQALAHHSGDIHIHDFDFYSLTTTCCQIQLTSLFKGGFSTGHGYLREPNDISSYAALACIAIQSNQNDQHGGQSIVDFDYGLSDGVRKTYKKLYTQNLYKGLKMICALDPKCKDAVAFEALSKEAKRQKDTKTTQGIVENLIHPVYLSTPQIEELKLIAVEIEKTTGHNRKLDTDSDYIKAEKQALLARGFSENAVDKAQEFSITESYRETDKTTYQAMEALIHNLNTMHSRAGAQTPFSSVNYGTDTSSEGRMVMKNMLDATYAGLGMGETPIFPIQIFRVKEGVNFNKGDPNYDLFIRSCEVSAKRLFPNFSFIDAPFNLQYYKAGHPETEIAYMGCRTRVMGNVFDPENQIAPRRGNLSFTSINLPRLAIQSNKDEKLFFQKLNNMMDLVVGQLLDRFRIQCSKHVYNFPFLMGQGVWLDSEKLGFNDTVEQVLKHGSLSIGFIGLAETLVALYGHHHGESDEMQQKGLKIISYMRKYLDDLSQKMKLNFTLLATPAEGLSGRFIRLDKKKFGIIKGVTDRDYYTNSFHIPVYYPISVTQKIEKEAPYHTLTNAGHITYVELDGDTACNVDAFVSVIRYMHDKGIGYGSINHPVDRDPVCGYVGVIGDVCPRCGRHEGEALSTKKIAELKAKYPDACIGEC